MSDKYKLSPLSAAIGSVFIVPITSILLVVCAIALLVILPLIPFAVYFKAKEDKP